MALELAVMAKSDMTLITNIEELTAISAFDNSIVPKARIVSNVYATDYAPSQSSLSCEGRSGAVFVGEWRGLIIYVTFIKAQGRISSNCIAYACI